MKNIFQDKDSQRFGREAGISILELLIVCAIVAIISVIAVVQVSTSLQYNRLNTLNAAISSKLAEARIQAIKRNSEVSLKVNFDSRRIWIEAGGEQLGGSETYRPENTVQFSPSANATQETVTFNSFGTLLTPPATIKVNNVYLKRTKSLQISLSGKIKVSEMTPLQ